MNTAPDAFDELLAALRPRLHRYCARMAGSAIDGEDIVQEALLRAHQARASAATVDHLRAWVFRIAHNAALDFLRRQARAARALAEADVDLDALAAPAGPDPDLAGACLHAFLHLPPLQRSAVILKDVLDHSLEEAAAITGATGAAVKSALQRGRARLRTLGPALAEAPARALDGADRTRLAAWVAGFHAGEFDAIRALLAEDVHLDLVAKLERRGKGQVGEYLGRYAACAQWAYAAGEAEGWPVMLVFDREVSLAQPAYVVVLAFDGARVAAIRDFLFARYVMDDLAVHALA